MYFSTSDGKTVWKMDSCSCCQMNTMGEHEWNCPVKVEKVFKNFSYPEYIKKRKAEIDAHPEWEISYI